MVTYLQALILGALQGFTELFPISSLGHTVILPSLLGWRIDQSADFFVIFLVATHFATALVLLGFFWKDWYQLMLGFFRSLSARAIRNDDTYSKLSWLIIIATIPAGLLGLLFEHTLRDFFAAPAEVSLFLIGNGILLYGVEKIRRNASSEEVGTDPDAAIAKLSFGQALVVGVFQSLALFPGVSRTGATLGGGLVMGLSHESAARFSFFLATPIILAAALLKLPLLLHAGSYSVSIVLMGAGISALTAYLSVKFLTKYFKTHTLTPFAIYCVLAGLVSFFILH